MALDVATITPTGNVLIDGLLNGTKWSTTSFTFNFPANSTLYSPGYAEALSPAFAQLNASMQTATRFALTNYASVANLTFTEVASNVMSDLPSAYTAAKPGTKDADSQAWAYMPSTVASGGDVWYNTLNGTDNINGVKADADLDADDQVVPKLRLPEEALALAVNDEHRDRQRHAQHDRHQRQPRAQGPLPHVFEDDLEEGHEENEDRG